jgi:hypothetical protein
MVDPSADQRAVMSVDQWVDLKVRLKVVHSAVRMVHQWAD